MYMYMYTYTYLYIYIPRGYQHVQQQVHVPVYVYEKICTNEVLFFEKHILVILSQHVSDNDELDAGMYALCVGAYYLTDGCYQ